MLCDIFVTSKELIYSALVCVSNPGLKVLDENVPALINAVQKGVDYVKSNA